jgi:flagellin
LAVCSGTESAYRSYCHYFDGHFLTAINTNIKSLAAHSALKLNERANMSAMQQLSTGKRINSSMDDAAGVAIAARMTENIRGLDQAIRNAGDGIALIQVAEGATNEITKMLQRMSELAVQSSNATYSLEQRGYLNQEFQQLKQEIIRIADTHEWNGFPILNGKSSSGENKQVKSEDVMPSISWSHGSSAQTESAQVIFKPLNPGQSVTVAGLTYTAKTLNSAQDLAKAFSNIKPNTTSQDITIENTPKGNFTGTLVGFGSDAETAVATVENRQFPTYIEFFDKNRSSEKISLREDALANISSGTISFVNKKMYLGDGTNANLIGQLDPAFDGANGVLRFNYVRGFANFNFDSGLVGNTTIDGWAATNARVKLDGSSMLAGYPTLTDTTTANGGLEATALTSSSYSVALANDTPTGQGLSVKLSSSLGGVVNTPAGIGGVVHGPALTSNSSVLLNAGDVISFDWKAAGGGDAYDVAAYLVDTQTGNTELLLDKTGGAPGSPSFSSAWSTQNHTVTKSGNYRFAFVSGSWDATGGRAAGATLYIDNIDIQANSGIDFSASQIQNIHSKFEFTDQHLDTGKTIFTSQILNSNVNDLSVTANANDALARTAQFDFRVGANKEQVIQLNIANFGKDGDITGAITSDTLSTNILTLEASNQVVTNINVCLDQISVARANMGAVINRLEHVLDNLSNVVVNSEASRSRVEDADYAKSSTLLAQTQIKKQAATAVLAQANLSSQMVLKLLGN